MSRSEDFGIYQSKLGTAADLGFRRNPGACKEELEATI